MRSNPFIQNYFSVSKVAIAGQISLVETPSSRFCHATGLHHQSHHGLPSFRTGLGASTVGFKSDMGWSNQKKTHLATQLYCSALINNAIFGFIQWRTAQVMVARGKMTNHQRSPWEGDSLVSQMSCSFYMYEWLCTCILQGTCLYLCGYV
jgi:hypothetical protein